MYTLHDVLSRDIDEYLFITVLIWRRDRRDRGQCRGHECFK